MFGRWLSLSWFFSSLQEGRSELQASGSHGFVGVCVGTGSCAVSCLFTWLCLNPDQDFLGNHSELDKQQFVTLALFLLFQTVVVMVRKAQAVARRWVRCSRPLRAGQKQKRKQLQRNPAHEQDGAGPGSTSGAPSTFFPGLHFKPER